MGGRDLQPRLKAVVAYKRLFAEGGMHFVFPPYGLLLSKTIHNNFNILYRYEGASNS